MSSSRKRELIREYKEREKRAGLFALRCAATGAVWVVGDVRPTLPLRVETATVDDIEICFERSEKKISGRGRGAHSGAMPPPRICSRAISAIPNSTLPQGEGG